MLIPLRSTRRAQSTTDQIVFFAVSMELSTPALLVMLLCRRIEGWPTVSLVMSFSFSPLRNTLLPVFDNSSLLPS